MKKRNVYKILFLIGFWELCTIFVTLYDGAVIGFKSEINGQHYSIVNNLLAGILVTFVGASLLGTVEVLGLSKLFRKKSLGISLFIKTAVYLIFILFFTSLVTVYLYSQEINQPMLSAQVMQLYSQVFLGPRLVSVFLFWGVACLLALFLLHVNEKFGQGVLLNFLLGKYHRPKEDQRIFMFMDLKSSTTYAEKLGHIRYSRLIQDCFFDLTDVVVDHKAQIYQYVGDEVVLSWTIQDGLDNHNCITTFFAYDNVIQSKQEYYLSQYGMVPEFKAGVNLGAVTVAEVGEIKKELAFHGDVLHTAARIQARCNEYKQRLLISEALKTQLAKKTDYIFDLIGNILLKGKQNPVNIYAVRTACTFYS